MSGGSESLEHGDLVAFAESRGGQLLSAASPGPHAKLRWRCGRGHEFEASPRLLVRGGYWCPQCAPSIDDTRGWDWDAQARIDPLITRFRRAD